LPFLGALFQIKHTYLANELDDQVSGSISVDRPLYGTPLLFLNTKKVSLGYLFNKCLPLCFFNQGVWSDSFELVKLMGDEALTRDTARI